MCQKYIMDNFLPHLLPAVLIQKIETKIFRVWTGLGMLMRHIASENLYSGCQNIEWLPFTTSAHSMQEAMRNFDRENGKIFLRKMSKIVLRNWGWWISLHLQICVMVLKLYIWLPSSLLAHLMKEVMSNFDMGKNQWHLGWWASLHQQICNI